MPAKNTIVFPTDFSESSCAALPWVIEMCSRPDSELHVLSVAQPAVMYAPVMGVNTAMASSPTADQLLEDTSGHLETFVGDHLSDVGCQVITAARVGRPASEIIGYARDMDAAMIVMATHGHTGVAHLLIGSTAEDVVRRAACPVLTVRSD